MDKAPYNRKTLIRFTGRTKQALERTVSDLKASGRLRVWGDLMTQEDFLNLSWLWLETLGAEKIEEAFAPHVPRLEAFLREAAGSGHTERHEAAFIEVEGEEIPPPPPKKRPPKRKPK